MVGAVAMAIWQLDSEPVPLSGFKPVETRRTLFDRGFQVADVNRVVVSRDDTELVLERDRTNWRLSSAAGYPVSADSIEPLLETVANAAAVYVSEQPSDALAEFEVGDHEAAFGGGTLLTLVARETESPLRVIVGSRFTPPTDPDAQFTFVRYESDSRVWLVDRAIILPSDEKDWIDTTILEVPSLSVVERSTETPNGARYIVRRDDSGALNLAEGPVSARDLEGPWVLEAFMASLASVQFDEVRPVTEGVGEDEKVWHTNVMTEDGIAYKIRLAVTDDGEVASYWATFRAAASNDAVSSESADVIERFNQRHNGWEYRLLAPARDSLSLTRADIVQ
jgi:hypothetical protein